MGTELFSTETILSDGGTAVVGADGSASTGMIGTAASGTAGQIYPIAGTDTDVPAATFAGGDLPDQVVTHLLRSKGRRVLAVRGAGGAAGVAGAASLLSGTGPTVPTFTGTPNEDAEFRLKIISTGSQTTATYQVSFNRGRSWSATRTATAGAVAMGNGVSVTFPTGTYTANAVFGAAFTGPRNTLANITDAADSLIESPYRFGMIHVLGAPATAEDLFTLAAALEAKAEAAVALGKMFDFVLEAPAIDPALLVAEADGFAGKNVVIAGGWADLFDENDRRIEKVSYGRGLVPRLARNPLSVVAMRDQTDTALDPIFATESAIWPDEALKTGADGYIDSARLPGLNDARFSTPWTIPGHGGSYEANTFTFADLTSDFSWYPNKRAANRGREVLYDLMWDRAKQRLPVDPTSGLMAAPTAVAIQRAANEALKSALVDGGHATGVQAFVNRASTSAIRIKARAVVVQHNRESTVDFGLALSLAA